MDAGLVRVLLPIDIDAEGRGPSVVRVMVIGGDQLGKQDPAPAALAAADIYAYDVKTRALRRERSIALNRGRIMGDSHILPDGNVVVVGGAESGYTNENRNRIRKAELIRPPSEEFAGDSIDLAESTELRGYHASSVLLPDGAIFVAGGNGNWNSGPIDKFKSVEVFEPPYLLLGNRPVILTAPEQLRPGQTFTVSTNNADVENVVVLIRNSSRTHSLDTDQRMLRLQAQRTVPKPAGLIRAITLTARLPSNPTLIPPGPRHAVPAPGGRGHDRATAADPVAGTDRAGGRSRIRPPVTVNRVRITIQTGSDDLRGGDDRAFAAFFDYANNPVGGEFALNGRATWGNHRQHRFACAFVTCADQPAAAAAHPDDFPRRGRRRQLEHRPSGHRLPERLRRVAEPLRSRRPAYPPYGRTQDVGGEVLIGLTRR